MIQHFLTLDYALKNHLLRGLTRLLFRHIPPERVRRVLVVRVGTLGDGICALPALQTIRDNFPQAHLTLLTRTGGPGLVSLGEVLAPGVVDAVLMSENRSFWQVLNTVRVGRYDLVIELSQSHARLRDLFLHLVWAKLAGIPGGYGWQITATRLFRRFQAQHRIFTDERTRLLTMLSENGLYVAEMRFPVHVTPADEGRVEHLLGKHGCADPRRNVALVVGAKRATNRWPLAYFDALSQALAEREFHVLLVGGPGDAPLAAQLRQHDRLHDFTGDRTVGESAALLAQCLVCVANDTGPMHLAYAVGTPVVARLSAPDYPRRWFAPPRPAVFGTQHVTCAGLRAENSADRPCQ
ncbi:MAG: glycosyltransferase family 9 protein, partial [Sphingobacteriaceae bacterium]|nr:glycosyltransferase family 9 protein [Cytophagaceae bacterium]